MMRTRLLAFSTVVLLATACQPAQSESEVNEVVDVVATTPAVQEVPDSVLRHAVYFAYKPETSQEKIAEIESAFAKLQTSIPGIEDFEMGTNSSPEGINKGLTHAYLLTFYSNEARDAYLPHPEHKAFGELLGTHLQDVMVIDYWTK